MRNCASGGNVGKSIGSATLLILQQHLGTTRSVGECILVTKGNSWNRRIGNSAACNGSKLIVIVPFLNGGLGENAVENAVAGHMRVRTIAAGGGASGAGLFPAHV